MHDMVLAAVMVVVAVAVVVVVLYYTLLYCIVISMGNTGLYLAQNCPNHPGTQITVVHTSEEPLYIVRLSEREVLLITF